MSLAFHASVLAMCSTLTVDTEVRTAEEQEVFYLSLRSHGDDGGRGVDTTSLAPDVDSADLQDALAPEIPPTPSLTDLPPLATLTPDAQPEAEPAVEPKPQHPDDATTEPLLAAVDAPAAVESPFALAPLAPSAGSATPGETSPTSSDAAGAREPSRERAAPAVVSTRTSHGGASSVGAEIRRGSGTGAGEPLLVANPRPTYPRAAMERGLEGSVLCALHVDERGAVSKVEIVATSGHTLLDRAAVEALSRWRFAPLARDGRPAPFRFEHRVRFRLE